METKTVARTVAGSILTVMAASCSMIGSMGSPSAKAEVFAVSSSTTVMAVDAALSRGEQVGAMLLPDHSIQLSNMVILKGVGRTGLKVINGADSFDAERIQRYKEQAGGKFDIAPEDKVKFEGVRYIIVYSHFSEQASDGPFINRGQASGYHENRIEMKFWDIASGQLAATCEASGVYKSANKYDGMDEAIATALLDAKLPGVSPTGWRPGDQPTPIPGKFRTFPPVAEFQLVRDGTTRFEARSTRNATLKALVFPSTAAAADEQVAAALRGTGIAVSLAREQLDEAMLAKFRWNPAQPEPHEAVALTGYDYVVLANAKSEPVGLAAGFTYENSIDLVFYVLDGRSLIKIATCQVIADYDGRDDFSAMADALSSKLTRTLPGASQK